MVPSWKQSSMALLVGSTLIAACASVAPSQEDVGPSPGGEAVGTSDAAISLGTLPPPGPTTKDTPIGLAFDIEDGTPVPLKVRKNQRFYINQIDMRASLTATTDEGVRGLDQSGDFASLDWGGTEQVDQSFLDQPNADGTWTRRRFFRKSHWMDQPSAFVIEQLDAHGKVTDAPLVIDTGLEYLRTPIDSFFTRRLRAIQWTYDCPAAQDCTGAKSFGEEALVELRYSNGPVPGLQFKSNTTQLRVVWSLKPTKPYIIPVEQVENPEWDYGFGIDVKAVTPPGNANGTFAPGQDVTFEFTLRDGSGKPLNPDGALPSFADYLTGDVPNGVQYWNLSEPYVTYYRRKHKERQMFASINGPAQDIQPLRTVAELTSLIDGLGDFTVGTQARDGVYGSAASIPSAFVLFDPSQWANPVDNHFTFHIPEDAVPGTYLVTLKARRAYLGEDIPRATTLRIQVGTKTVTKATLHTGNCQSCHKDGSDFTRISHGLKDTDRDTCATCHAPQTSELEGPVYVRAHFIHSRTDRFNASVKECKNCHIDREGIERTSKSACLSCHKSYPQSHVQQFGPITDMFIGGGTESFQQCTNTCHTNHPDSGL